MRRRSHVFLGPVGARAGVPVRGGIRTGVGVVALLAAAGCSGGADAASAGGAKARPAAAASIAAGATPEPAEAVRDAVAATRDTSVRIDQRIELGDGTKTYRMSITGDFDMAGDRGRLSVDLPGGAVSHLDEIFLDDKVYLRGIHGLDGNWGSIDRDRGEAHAVLRAPLNDPEHVLVQVAAVKTVSDEGTAKVNGAPATHYRGTLDHATTTLRITESLRERFDKARESLGQDIPVFADAWVDEAGRVVRTRLTFATSGVGVKTTTTYSDFGKRVRATAPPAVDTVPVTEVQGVLPG